MVMSKNSLFEVFESSWPKWETAVLGYATGTKNKTQGLCSALKDLHPASDSDTEDEEEHTSSGKFMQHIIFIYLIYHGLYMQFRDQYHNCTQMPGILPVQKRESKMHD